MTNRPRPAFGQPPAAPDPLDRYAGRMGALPIVDMCAEPAAMRVRAAAGRGTPCYRCLAARPDTASGCHFTERR
jgi:hypothetical protein